MLCQDCPYRSNSHTPSSRSLHEILAAMLRAKAAANRRPKYLLNLRQYLNAFNRGRESEMITKLTIEDVEAWLAKAHHTPHGRASGITRLNALFSYAIKQGWLRDNPCTRVERVTTEPIIPQILTPTEAAKVLNVVRSGSPRGLAWVVLTLLCGVRPSEAERLSWQAIDLEAGIIRLEASMAKTRRRRIIHLMPSALAWLKVAQAVGSALPIPHWTRRNIMRRLRPSLTSKPFPQDIFRHSCASYMLAELRDAGRVAEELGNSPNILRQYYIELVTPAQAHEFWSILP